MIDVVAVDRPDIEEAELVEQRAAGDEAARVFLDSHARFANTLEGMRLAICRRMLRMLR